MRFGDTLYELAKKAGLSIQDADNLRFQGNNLESNQAMTQGWVSGSTNTISNVTITAASRNVMIDDNGIKIYNNAILTGQWHTDGDLQTGSDISAAATTSFNVFTNDQTYNGEAMGAGDAMLGDNTVGAANVLWDASVKQLKFRGGTTTQGYIDTDGKAVFGGGAVNLDVNGLKLINGGVTCVDLQVDGDTFFGSNIAAAATTGFSTFATAQTYNTEAIGAGDVLFGDNSVNKANMLWDVSDGQMKFRSGQTVQGWIDIDGTTYFSGGAVKLSASEFTSETLTNCDLETVYPYATGGNITTSGGKRIHTFNADGTFTVTHAGNVEILVVAGGGGGGYAGIYGGISRGAGGGGAGGIIYNSSFAVAPGAISVTVGDGGAAASSIAEKGINGEDSMFSTLTAVGGGGGGSAANAPTGLNKGANGGSGGGAAAAGSAVAASSGTFGQGNNGGAFASDKGGTGGGGCGQAGSANVVDTGGDGGDGTAYTISGASVAYGGGGGGGGFSVSPNVGGIGGTGGGGNGGGGADAAVAGTANLGGGGGGGKCRLTSGDAGAAGGSGIVIISYTDNAGTETFDDWTDTEGDGTITNELSLFHDGAHAAKLVSGATSNTKIAQAATVTASTVAQLTFWTRGDGTYAGRYAVYDVSNSTYITAATSTGVTGTVYEQLTFLVTIPAGCISARVELWCPSTNTGVAYFDDIHFKGMTIGNVVIGGQISAGTLVLGGNAVNEISTDTTMAGDSDSVLPTEHVVKTFVDARASTDGWIAAGETWTYATANTFTVPTDLTAKYGKGTKIKLTDGTVKYFVVVASAYGAPNTTVTVTGGTGYTLSGGAISNPFLSYLDTPQLFPDWFSWTPTYAATGSMTYTSVTTTYAKFRVAGRTCYFNLRATGTTGGTASTTVTATTPVTKLDTTTNLVCVATVIDSGNWVGRGVMSSTSLIGIGRTDFTTGDINFGLGAGRIIMASGFYEF